MQNTVVPRSLAGLLLALLYTCGFAVAPALAQMGPIEPIIITGSKPGKALADIPDLKDDLMVSVQVTVAPDGTVSSVVVSPSSGNEAADVTAIRFMKEKKFLPALDANAQPVEAKVMGTVELQSKTINKQLKANMKAPNSQTEVARVRKLTCKDFTWEVSRLHTEGDIVDVSREFMPWVSLRVYMLDNGIASDREAAYLEKWPKVIKEAEKACAAAPEKSFLTGVLTPLLNVVK
jgi:TonB family protein